MGFPPIFFRHINNKGGKFMVTTETLQVIINAKDMLSGQIRNVNNAINQTGTTARNATNTANSAYTQLQNKVRSVFNNIRNVMKNSTAGNLISSSGLAKPFMNAAEQIKQKWQTTMQQIKSATRVMSNVKVSTGGISNAGLATLNGQVATTTTKVTLLSRVINTVGTGASSLGLKFSNAFQSAQAKIGTFTSKLRGVGQRMQSLVGGLSGVQSAILGAFGAVGVTSMSQFTIGAAIARQKLNAVTTGITGSEEATNKLNKAISAATKGGIVGFTNVAKAVQQVGLKYGLSNDQLAATAPVLNKIGTLARAMGKDSTTAATIMSKAYDGLNGNFMLLQRNLGITKEQLLAEGWSGAADDVDGYTNALQKVLDKKPEMQEYLNSYEGQMERLKMAVAGVGRQIGEIFLPILNSVLGAFLDINEKAPWLTSILVGAGVAILGIISVMSMLAPVIMMIIELREAEAFATWAAYLPYLLIAAAIIALIAILWHLYNTNDKVRAIMDAVGKTVKETVVKAWENLQKIIQPLIPTWNHFCDVVGRAVNQFLSFFGITREGGGEFDALTGIIQVLGLMFQGLVEHITLVVQVLAAILVPAINLVLNVVSNLINFITTLGEAFTLLMSGDILGFLSVLIEALTTFLMSTLTNIGQFVLEILNNLNVIFGNVLSLVWAWILNLVTSFIVGASSAVNGFIIWISTLPGRLWLWLVDAWNRFLAWRAQVADGFRRAASDAVNGFINYVSGLPGRLWSWLVQAAGKVTSFGSQARSKMLEAARGMVDNFKNKIKSLPGIMWSELMNIKAKIQNGIGSLGNAIANLGWRLLDRFKSALGINSPGHMSHAIEDEMGYIGGYMEDAVRPLRNRAVNLGDSILSGFMGTGAGNISAGISGANGSIAYNVRHSVDDASLNVNKEEVGILNAILALLNDILDNQDKNNVTGGAVSVTNDGSIQLEHHITVDGLPDGVDSEAVYDIVREAFTDRELINMLVSSREFQALDNRMKTRILGTYSRHI